jgi:hypothetical protein
MADEYKLNLYYNGGKLPLSYSDGLQATQYVPAPADPKYAYMDMNGDGILSDDERDADGDHLGNWDEKYGRMTQAWWDAVYNGQGGNPKETRYPQDFAGTSMTDPDTDGDGIPDGADDQDHDGLSNSFELSRPPFWQWTYVSVNQQPAVDNYNATHPSQPAIFAPNPWARVQPFNPCKPVWSKTCHLHWGVGYYGDTEDWMGANPNQLKPPPATPQSYAGEN